MMLGWESASIGDLCDVVNGGTPKTGVSEYWGDPHCWITPAEMGKRSTPYIGLTDRTITDQGLQSSSARLLPPYSVILSSRAPIGHLVINTAPMATNQGCKGLIPRSRIDHKFLYYYLGSIVNLLNELGTGTTFKELSGGKLKEVRVPIPPIAEQRRIVAILDEAFEAIAIAKANAEKNLENAREVFESYLDAVFLRRGPDWVEMNLGSACDLENGDRGKNYPNRDEYVESGIPWINTGHIRPDGTLSRAEMNFITREKFTSLRSGKIRAGDLVYCLRGATLGKTALVDPLTEGAVASSLVIVRPAPFLDSRFLYFFLTSPHGQGLIKGFENGAAQPNLGARSVAKFPISIPPAVEQERIVETLIGIREEAQRLADLCQRKLEALDELKESLLHKAFTGQLTSAKTTPAAVVQALPTTSPEYSANVIALAYERHKRQQRERTFGHVKEQKLLHLVEAIAKVDLGRQPMKDAAGPNDFPHMLKAEEWAKRNGFFEMVQREGGYDFKKLPAFDQLLAKAPQVLGADLARIESVIDLLVPMDTVDAEVLATVHAAWNNLLIDGAEITDAALIREARDGWHADKLAIPESKFRQAITLIRSKGLVPDGTGKYVGGQTSLL